MIAAVNHTYETASTLTAWMRLAGTGQDIVAELAVDPDDVTHTWEEHDALDQLLADMYGADCYEGARGEFFDIAVEV